MTNNHEEVLYKKFPNADLIIYSIYSILKNGETCTFERLVAECFKKFPESFGFKRYPEWPDSLKLDRQLRTLRQKGFVVGGAGGSYSPGKFQLTEFGDVKAKEIEKAFISGKSLAFKKKKGDKPRSVDEKLIKYVKESDLFKNFLVGPEGFTISESEFRSFLRCTLETPARVLKQNLEYYKNVAKSYEEKEILDFLNFCEKKFIRKGAKDG